jgi:hypothetical protein
MRRSFHIVLALFFLQQLSFPIPSQEMTFKPEIHTTDDGVRYISTGIGYDSRVNMPRFPLHLIFCTKNGAYLAEIDIEISPGPKGNPTTIHSPGPWLDIDLPAGTYQIRARTPKGQEFAKRITVVEGKVTQVKLAWNISDEDI